MKELAASVTDLTETLGVLDSRTGREVAKERAELAALGERLRARQAYAPSTLVIGLAGSTGAGKSSLFNALTGSTAAKVGVKRPTTTAPLAAIFGEPEDGVGALLDWLDVTERYFVGEPAPDLGKAIILDLPDIDSISEHNRELARRFISAVDVIIWVVDPEKYADSRFHDEYLRPHAAHAPVMEVLLNQVDRLTPDDARSALADLKRLLAAAGIDSGVYAVSIATGAGVDAVGVRLHKRSLAKRDQLVRARADAVTIARRLQQTHPFETSPSEMAVIAEQLQADVLAAAQVSTYVDAATARYRHDVTSAIGWPPYRAVRKSRTAPTLPSLSTGFLGEPIGRLRAAFAGPGAWHRALRTSVDDSASDLTTRLATYQPRLADGKIGRGLRLVGAGQWVGILILALAAIMFAVEILARYVGITLTPAVAGVPGGDGYPPLPALSWSVLLAIIGGLVTLVVMSIAAVAIRIAMSRYRRRATAEVSTQVKEMVDAAVLAPVTEIVDQGTRYQRALTKITSQTPRARSETVRLAEEWS